MSREAINKLTFSFVNKANNNINFVFYFVSYLCNLEAISELIKLQSFYRTGAHKWRGRVQYKCYQGGESH